MRHVTANNKLSVNTIGIKHMIQISFSFSHYAVQLHNKLSFVILSVKNFPNFPPSDVRRKLIRAFMSSRSDYLSSVFSCESSSSISPGGSTMENKNTSFPASDFQTDFKIVQFCKAQCAAQSS